MNKSLKLSTAGLIAATLLSACGGGGGGTSTGGTAANTVSQGTITGFGSVIVDGVRYSSVGALVRDDEDNLISRDDLRIGMTVNVEGTSSDDLASGEARTIEVRKLLQGAVTNLLPDSAGNNKFTVLSQNVQTTANTLIVGNLVEAANVQIFGVLKQDPNMSANDTVVASRIDVVPRTKYEAYGRVSAVASGSTSFNIGNLVVTPDSSFGGSLPAGLAIGSLVKVSCQVATTPVCSNGESTLTASKIKLRGARSDLNGKNGALVKLHGVIDNISGNVLTVGGVQIDISNATRGDDNGADSWTPAVAQLIEAKGTYNSSNVLVATRIEQEGYREQKSGSGDSSRYSTELYGIVSDTSTLAGCTASYVVQSTCVNQGAVIPVPTTGNYVEIKGNMSNTGDVLDVVKVEIKNGSEASGGYIELKGRISGLNNTTFTLNGTTVNYANARLIGTPANDSYAEVKGSQDANKILQATKVEVEVEDVPVRNDD